MALQPLFNIDDHTELSSPSPLLLLLTIQCYPKQPGNQRTRNDDPRSLSIDREKVIVARAPGAGVGDPVWWTHNTQHHHHIMCSKCRSRLTTNSTTADEDDGGWTG